MKKAILIFSLLAVGSVAAQTDSKYPLKFQVQDGEQHWGGADGRWTEGNAVLLFRDGSELPRQVVYHCDGRIQVGTYQARLKKTHELKVLGRDAGSDKSKEFTCKF